MATIGGHRIALGSCVLLMFTIGRAVQEDMSVMAAVTDGVYPVESKRTITTDSETGEFLNPSNLRGDYGEYPIVPKRAALLLDRLMVALHHALEDERHGRRRLSEIYARDKTPSFLLNGGSIADFDPTEHDNMYSDEEEPGFDFRNLRELKSPNRGSGETLMAKSFQRRAPHDEDSVSGRGSGRVYWRCYFNAVSCF